MNIQPQNPGATDDFTPPNGSPATSAAPPQDDENVATSLNTDALEAAVDDEIARADLDDQTLEETEIETDDDLSTSGFDVVLQSDLADDGAHRIHSPELSAPDTPGEIDIEDLDESDLDGTPLPDDARLDPIED